MKIAVYILAGLLGVLGLFGLFAAGEGNAVVRVIISLILLAAAATVVALSRLRPQHHTHEMKVEMPGETSLEQIQCKQCGATLSSKSVRVSAGAVFVSCEFCGAEYQLEEAPKW